MENAYSRLSNIYTPSLSANFVMKKFNELETIDSDSNLEEDAILDDLYLPCEVINGCKGNQTYKKLIEELKINDLNNKEALEMITKEIKLNQKKRSLNLELIPINDNNSTQQRHEELSITNKELKIIYLWRASKLSLHSIAYKVGV